MHTADQADIVPQTAHSYRHHYGSHVPNDFLLHYDRAHTTVGFYRTILHWKKCYGHAATPVVLPNLCLHTHCSYATIQLLLYPTLADGYCRHPFVPCSAIESTIASVSDFLHRCNAVPNDRCNCCKLDEVLCALLRCLVVRVEWQSTYITLHLPSCCPFLCERRQQQRTRVTVRMILGCKPREVEHRQPPWHPHPAIFAYNTNSKNLSCATFMP